MSLERLKKMFQKKEDPAITEIVDYLTDKTDIYPQGQLDEDERAALPQPAPTFMPEKTMPQAAIKTTSKRGLNRRTFLKAAGMSALGWVGQNVEQHAKALEVGWYVLNDPYIRDIAFPPSLEEISEQQTTAYDQNALSQTRILAFGDSTARGQVDNTKKDAAPAGFIVGKVNKFLEKNAWSWHNAAWNGATTQDVLYQIKNIQPTFESTVPTDALLSVGGNDMLSFIDTPETMQQLDKLLDNPSNMELLQVFAKRINRFLTAYKENLAEVITTFNELPQKGISLQRLYVHGMPHMGNAKNIVLPNGTKLPLRGAVETLATNVSKLINHATYTTIQAHPASYPILYIDHASLTSDEFSDMHPNEKGYERMANEQMKQGIVYLPTGPKTLYDLVA